MLVTEFEIEIAGIIVGLKRASANQEVAEYE